LGPSQREGPIHKPGVKTPFPPGGPPKKGKKEPLTPQKEAWGIRNEKPSKRGGKEEKEEGKQLEKVALNRRFKKLGKEVTQENMGPQKRLVTLPKWKTAQGKTVKKEIS